MSRYDAMFAAARAKGEGVFGAFLMLGDPNPQSSADLLDAAVAGGADMIEVGIPFSDPVADGPVIQAAAERALKAGVRTVDCFEMIAGFRRRHPNVPLGILTYANIVLARGLEGFGVDAARAGADSLLVADVPFLEAAPFAAAATAAGLAPVLIAASNTPPATLRRIAALGAGYTYCVARAGVTGADENVAFDHAKILEILANTGAPPSIFGFGISTPAHVAQALAAGAAGAISGSAIARLSYTATEPVVAVRRFVMNMKAATRS